MSRYILDQNIRHYKKLLAEETDEEKLRVLRKLLAEEETKARDHSEDGEA